MESEVYFCFMQEQTLHMWVAWRLLSSLTRTELFKIMEG
jgi:hypothetical protein